MGRYRVLGMFVLLVAPVVLIGATPGVGHLLARRVALLEGAVGYLNGRLDELEGTVSALRAEVEGVQDSSVASEQARADHEDRLAALERGQARLVVVDANGVVIGDAVPGSVTGLTAAVFRASGTYTVSEAGFLLSRSLIYRDPACLGPLVTVDADFPGVEAGTQFFPVENAVALTDGRAYVRAANSIADEEGIASVTLFIPDGRGGCQTWGAPFAFDASRVQRLILRDDLTVFTPPFRVVGRNDLVP